MPNHYVLRTSDNRVDDGFVITGAGTANSAITDASDSTYIRKPNSSAQFDLQQRVKNPSAVTGGVSIPISGHFILSIENKVRLAQGATGVTYLTLWEESPLAQLSGNYTSGTRTVPALGANISSASRTAAGVLTATTSTAHGFAVNDLIMVTGSSTGTPSGFANGAYRILTVGTSTTFTAQDVSAYSGFTASTVNATNGATQIAWNARSGSLGSSNLSATTGTAAQSLIDDLLWVITDMTSTTLADRPTIYEAFTEVFTAALPTVTVTGIDGDTVAPYTVTTTTRPTVTWTHAQADGYAQADYRVKVFTSAQANPDTAAGAVFDSGTVTSGSSSCQITTDLINGTTYYVYVKTRTYSVPFLANDDGWSLWGSGTAGSTITFSVSLPVPTAPTVSAVWGTTQQRNRVTLTGAAVTAPMTAQTFDLQRSDDGGTTWVYVRGGTSKNPDGSFQVIVDDFEMKRNNTTRYRARSVATGAGNTIASAWGTVGTVAVPALTNWVFRSLGSTGELNIVKDVKVLSDLDLEQSEDVGVFSPMGRSAKVVVHGTVRGEDGTYNILAPDQASFDALIAVVNARALVLVADPFGEQKYVQVISRQYRKTGAAASPRYNVALGYVEVESGLTAG